MRSLPFWLVTLRLLLGPAVILMALHHRRGIVMVGCLFVALLSDIYDGRIARYYGVAGEKLRRYDSLTDTIFYVCVAISAWLLENPALKRVIVLLLALVLLELTRYVFDFMKFRREAAYHMWSAKLWGLFLASSAAVLLGWGIAGALLKITLIVGIVSDLEGLAISIVLPEWAHDVPTVWHALRMRAQLIHPV